MARAEKFPIKLVLGITQETDSALASWRREQPDLPSRSEAIRRLIQLGLKAEAEGRAKDQAQQASRSAA